MKEEPEARSRRMWEITIENDWSTTLFMAFLFVICSLLLAGEIRDVARGHFVREAPLHKSFFAIFLKVGESIAALLCFFVAFRFPKRSVRIAFLLMGSSFVVGILMSCIHTSLAVRNGAAIMGSFSMQVALVIFCVAIADWFRSMIRLSSHSEVPGDNP